VKQAIDTLDATPSKRLYQSIIADYDLNRSICELVDNGLDVWVRHGKTTAITIEILLNEAQQTIIVRDNAGGLRKSEMRYIVAPGETGTKETDETIGIFGVGTKRGVVALAQDIKITTRYLKEPTYQLDFDEQWLEDDENWELSVYEVDAIPEGTTLVELQKLRTTIDDVAKKLLKEHLQTTYAKFLTHRNVTIKLNSEALSSEFFENWAYPARICAYSIYRKPAARWGRGNRSRSSGRADAGIESRNRRIRCLFLL
jgi:DNA gyrase/topoisomerase IV subunit B